MKNCKFTVVYVDSARTKDKGFVDWGLAPISLIWSPV